MNDQWQNSATNVLSYNVFKFFFIIDGNESRFNIVDDQIDNSKKYHHVVGSLQYPLLTRPDITFSVSKLSFLCHPYSSGTQTLGIDDAQ